MAMTCPHCGTRIPDTFESVTPGHDSEGKYAIHRTKCPDCNKDILILVRVNVHGVILDHFLIWPKSTYARQAPTDVPEDLAHDFNEAALVLPASPKASAALSRRCLQHLLTERFRTKSEDLSKQIEEVLATNVLPGYLAENLDAVRVTGNFSAHPKKHELTGMIVDVEPHEAEWNLEILEGLFDFAYVQAKKEEAKRAALNEKLKAISKPEMKKPPTP